MNIAKDFFDRCRRLDQRIQGKLDELAHVRAIACGTTPSYSTEPRGSATAHSKVESGVSRLIELDQQINAEIDRYADYRALAMRIIDSIGNDRYRDILMWRYFSQWNWDRIAEAFDAERMKVWRLHGRALAEANAILNQPEYVDVVDALGFADGYGGAGGYDGANGYAADDGINVGDLGCMT